MKRIFLNLAIVDFLALVICFGLGIVFSSKGWRLDAGSIAPETSSAVTAASDTSYVAHFGLGLFSTIGNLGVHCLIFIYFLGTGRWVKEVAIAYKLPDVPYPRLTRDLKRRTFPPALFAMLVPIAAAVSGEGARRDWPGWIHTFLAIATLAVNLWAYRIEYRNVSVNGEVIDEVLHEVDRIRAENGLPPNAEALEQEAGAPGDKSF
jgi:hypothetical protein